MRELSLTEFIDFVYKVGTTKITKVRQMKFADEEYDPAKDYYKQIREKIIETHTQGQPLTHIANFINLYTNVKKKTNYTAIYEGYRRFIKKRQVSWFDPPRNIWVFGELTVKINPELGLVIDNAPHIIKLYFKGIPLTIQKVEAIIAMMNVSLDNSANDAKYAILDIQQAKLFTSQKPPEELMPLIEGEASSLIRMWNSISQT